MAFEFAKISDHGTNHPVIARLHLQTFDLLQASTVPQSAQESARTIYFEAGLRLVRCCDSRDELGREQEKLEAEYQPSSNQQAVFKPHLVDLNRHAETFLYDAKNFLREISKVFRAFDGPTFNEASALGKKALNWSEGTFGSGDRLTSHLRDNAPWIDQVIRMRNAVEHPGGWSGTLHIENFKFVSGVLQRPTWHLDDDPPLHLVDHIGELCEGLLVFSEELLALLIEKHLSPTLQIVGIPEEHRNASMPKRLKIDLRPEAWAKFDHGQSN